MLGQSTSPMMDSTIDANPIVLAEIHSTLLQQAARLYSIGYRAESDAVLATTKVLSTHIELISNDSAN